MINIYVIAPDKSSGHAFCDVLKRKNISPEFNFHKIRPRVINNQLTTSDDVVDDLNNIFKKFKDKTQSIVIACNTLQLWLNDIDPEYKKNVKIYTTFEACEWKFSQLEQRPVWLGTTPLVQRTKKFPTLISLGRPELQDLVQELIWRVKMYEGDDFNTAPEIVKQDKKNRKLQRRKIIDIRERILDGLKELKIKNVISGCTELPMIFNKPEFDGINFYDPADALAEYIKAQSVSIIFAGGTISSIADKSGLRASGQVFDLLEKLSERYPGSYKNQNVSKSEIVYRGMSENMTFEHHRELLKSVRKILAVGVSRIVITHGTDSLEQTARYLDHKLRKRLEENDTMIVLTGANEHASHRYSDAWDNLRTAIDKGKQFDEGGVYVAFANRFVPASLVVKDIFDGKSMKYTSELNNAYKVRLKKYEEKIKEFVKENNALLYDVNVIRKDHSDFLKKFEKIKPNTVVLKLYHSGTANTEDKQSSVIPLIKKLKSYGTTIYAVTENGEPTKLNHYESSVLMKKNGVVAVNLI